MKPETYHDRLKLKMDSYVHLIYKVTKSFPFEERYGVTSQIRRSAMSIILNYIEGYARQRDKVHKNFLELSYGSLKESKYLLHFSLIEKYLSKTDYKKTVKLADDIGAMLWRTKQGLADKI